MNDLAYRRQHHLSFKGNLKETRYGWLRLTPAYSLNLIGELLSSLHPGEDRVLDPFCGTGTTALACAERGLACDTTDINPFLIWLASTKAHLYTTKDVQAFVKASREVTEAIGAATTAKRGWVPPLFQIEKWWDEQTLSALAAAMTVIRQAPTGAANDLLKIAFCRAMIERANVSFGHQSMSFKKASQRVLVLLPDQANAVADAWTQAVASISRTAESVVKKPPRVLLCDARELTSALAPDLYKCVITSPPYPNRMSYIRELRPYMYWLGFLGEAAREAGELDWKAIGGTWGCATSNVAKWEPPKKLDIPLKEFSTILSRIAETSPLLSRYVHKYFYDMVAHTAGLFRVVAPGGEIHYVVGNSKFYDVLLPVERIFGALFEAAGFANVSIEAIRKRSSKKELFEYMVSAKRP